MTLLALSLGSPTCVCREGSFFFVVGKPVSQHTADGGPTLTAVLTELRGKSWLVPLEDELCTDVHQTLSQLLTTPHHQGSGTLCGDLGPKGPQLK